MIRARPFQQSMARLALVAMLLLALLPTLGRLAHPQSSGAQAGWAAICTAAGMRYVALLPPADHRVDTHAGGDHAPTSGALQLRAPPLQAPQPDAPPPHGGPDCDYCPLLAALIVAVLWLAMTAFVPVRHVAVAIAVACRRQTFHPCGLGSRGPPLAL